MNEKKTKIRTVIAVSLLILFLIGLGVILLFHSEIMDRQIKQLDLPFAVHPLIDPENVQLSSKNIFRMGTEYGGKTKEVSIRGIYVDVQTMSVEEKRKALLSFAKKNNINAFLFDLKDESGNVLYPSFIEEVHTVQRERKISYPDIREILSELEGQGIIPIARICAFKDSKIGEVYPDWVFKDSDGTVWKDRTGYCWMNPSSEKVVQYISSLLKEAVLLGFSEIMLDYVRFPTDVNSPAEKLAGEENTRVKVIGDFVTSLKNLTSNYSYHLSLITSGRIMGITGEKGTGQRLDMISRTVDIFSPMIFPANYFGGELGQKYPYTEPYLTVKESVSNALEELELIDDGNNDLRIRPILQAFSAPWLKQSYRDKYIEYGSKEINSQIRALQECGIQEWILWNNKSEYPNFEN